MDRPHFVTSYCRSSQPVEFFSLEKQKSRLTITALDNLDVTSLVRDITQDAKGWLPLAAEALCISADINDYVLVPTISMPSDLPNRNHQAFPLEELTAWCVDHGAPMFKTWTGQPCHEEHANDDPTAAKGIILDCSMRPIANSYGNIWKVLKLAAWDRRKDPALVNGILSGTRSSYSMGANCRYLECSVCGSRLGQPNHCNHVDLQSPRFKVVEGRVAYYNVIAPVGIELSTVASPAYFSAKDNKPLGAW